MATFRCQPLAELTRQLAFAPARRQREQMRKAEQLYWQLDPQRNYPLDFVVYHITGYPADASGDEPVTLVGEAVRADLLTLVDRLSEHVEDDAADHDPPPLTLDQLTAQLGVTAKTISRYRRRGLFARRFLFQGRKRIGFLPDSVERFLDQEGDHIREAGVFARMSEAQRHEILLRARRLAGRVKVSPFRVAQHLAPKYGRSVEAIRRLLVDHDRDHPRFAIFRDHRPPLSEAEQTAVLVAYRAGESVASLAKRYGKARDAMYRAIHRQRARQLRERRIDYVHSRTFDLPEAEEVLLTPPPAAEDHDAAFDLEDDEQVLAILHHLAVGPAVDRETEQALFAGYNYLKYRAVKGREQLDPRQPQARDLDRVETWLRQAGQLRRRIARAFRPRVIAVARQHKAGRASADVSLIDLVREGDYVLLNAIEAFDFTGRARFATYLNWALMRQFAQLEDEPTATPARSGLDGQAEEGQMRMNFAELTADLAAIEQPRGSRDQLLTLLDALNERERLIVTRHFGLANADGDAPVQPQTLEQIARQLNLPIPVAKRAERAALKKLRAAASEAEIDLGELRLE